MNKLKQQVKERYGVIFHGTNQKYYDEIISEEGTYLNRDLESKCGLTSFNGALHYAHERAGKYNSNPVVMMVNPEKINIDYNGNYFCTDCIPNEAHYKIDLTKPDLKSEFSKGLEKFEIKGFRKDIIIDRIDEF